MRVLHTNSLTETDYEQILSVLRAGGVIAFPTDTVYGLGGDPFHPRAIPEIFRLKGRPEGKPILLLVGSLQMTGRVAVPNACFYSVAEAFWPGPLTVILPAHPNLPSAVSAGSGTVGVRWPVASFACDLLERWGGPLTATSANRSGLPACATAAEVQAQLAESLDLLVDGGELSARLPSTLLDLTTEVPTVLREGPIDFSRLQAFFQGRVRKATA